MGLIKLSVFFFVTAISVCNCNVMDFFTRNKCFDELGCFYAGKPFFDIIERPMSLLPDDRETISTKFILYTLQSQVVFNNFNFSKVDLADSYFNPILKTKIVIPGFMSQFAEYWKTPLVESLLHLEPSNVFLVDWSGGDGPIYEQAVANTRIVGAEIALLLKKIQERYGLKLEKVHLIGHSLGSHIAGYAGKRLDKIGRITALDPAGPYFTDVDPIVRLDKSDALFVDAIHTNAAPSRFQGFGLTESIAHLDFWPNGGHLQPGCPNMGYAVWSFLMHPTLDYDGLHDLMCNHGRAIDMFFATVLFRDCKMYGVACESWEDFVKGKCDSNDSYEIGIHADHTSKYIDSSKSLNVYLNASVPFCHHMSDLEK